MSTPFCLTTGSPNTPRPGLMCLRSRRAVFGHCGRSTDAGFRDHLAPLIFRHDLRPRGPRHQKACGRESIAAHRSLDRTAGSVECHQYAFVQVGGKSIQIGILSQPIEKVVAIPRSFIDTGCFHRFSIEQM